MQQPLAKVVADMKNLDVIRMAAEAGDRNAAWELGSWFLEQGMSEAARRHFKISAEAGSPHGALAYGKLLLGGIGGSVDQGEAYRWLEASARQGHPQAQFIFGMACRNIRPAKSAFWVLIAADQGHQEAIKYLAERDSNGGISDEAIEAEAGDVVAWAMWKSPVVAFDVLNAAKTPLGYCDTTKEVIYAAAERGSANAAIGLAEYSLCEPVRRYWADMVKTGLTPGFAIFPDRPLDASQGLA